MAGQDFNSRLSSHLQSSLPRPHWANRAGVSSGVQQMDNPDGSVESVPCSFPHCPSPGHCRSLPSSLSPYTLPPISVLSSLRQRNRGDHILPWCEILPLPIGLLLTLVSIFSKRGGHLPRMTVNTCLQIITNICLCSGMQNFQEFLSEKELF